MIVELKKGMKAGHPVVESVETQWIKIQNVEIRDYHGNLEIRAAEGQMLKVEPCTANTVLIGVIGFDQSMAKPRVIGRQK